jgi:hypothetical protein
MRRNVIQVLPLKFSSIFSWWVKLSGRKVMVYISVLIYTKGSGTVPDPAWLGGLSLPRTQARENTPTA